MQLPSTLFYGTLSLSEAKARSWCSGCSCVMLCRMGPTSARLWAESISIVQNNFRVMSPRCLLGLDMIWKKLVTLIEMLSPRKLGGLSKIMKNDSRCSRCSARASSLAPLEYESSALLLNLPGQKRNVFYFALLISVLIFDIISYTRKGNHYSYYSVVSETRAEKLPS